MHINLPPNKARCFQLDTCSQQRGLCGMRRAGAAATTLDWSEPAASGSEPAGGAHTPRGSRRRPGYCSCTFCLPQTPPHCHGGLFERAPTREPSSGRRFREKAGPPVPLVDVTDKTLSSAGHACMYVVVRRARRSARRTVLLCVTSKGERPRTDGGE